MNTIIKLLMGLGCIGMYLGWRYAPETLVYGVGLNSLVIYGSLALVAAGFVAAMIFGDDLAHEAGSNSNGAALVPGEAQDAVELVVNPARSVVDVFYDDAGWRRF